MGMISSLDTEIAAHTCCHYSGKCPIIYAYTLGHNYFGKSAAHVFRRFPRQFCKFAEAIFKSNPNTGKNFVNFFEYFKS